VKLLCLHILLMAAYLVLPDAHRLLAFFVLNRATQPVVVGPATRERSSRILLAALKVCLIVYLFGSLTVRDWRSYKASGGGAPHVPLYGLYEVEDFSLGGVVHPPLVTDRTRWRYVMLETPGKLTVRDMDDSLTDYAMRYDAQQHAMLVDLPGDPAVQCNLKVVSSGDGGLQLDGTWSGSAVSVRLKPVDRNSFTLVSRGFHWVSETSFIR
jgi:hypothetical protein